MEINGQCSNCIRECETGKSFCHRRDEKGQLIQKNRFCVFMVDWLFEKPIIHFRKNSKILSIGSWGCNLRCRGCQNVHLSWSQNGNGLGFTEINPEELVQLAMEKGCEGICFTYNEPAILLEEVEEIARSARKKGIFTVLVTNCTLTRPSAKRIARCIDAVAADIKSLEDDFYYEYCGAEGIPDVANKVLDCIKTFTEAGCHIEIRTNIIPGGNDQEITFSEIAAWIRTNLGENTPWHITRFFPAHELLHIPPTPADSMLKAQKTGLEAGLKHVYTYFSQGCDCAKESFLLSPETEGGKRKIMSCCE